MRAWFVSVVVLSGCATILRSTSEASPLPVLSCGGQLDPDSELGVSVMTTVRDRQEQFGWCVQGNGYDSARGKYVFVWDIKPDGRTENVGVNHASLAGEPLAHCLADEFRRMRFAKSETGARGVCFPMRF